MGCPVKYVVVGVIAIVVAKALYQAACDSQAKRGTTPVSKPAPVK